MSPPEFTVLERQRPDAERPAPMQSAPERDHVVLVPSRALLEAEADIEGLLAKHRFTTPGRHLDQAFVAHVEGRWAKANLHIAAFLELLLEEIATRIDPSTVMLRTPFARSGRLASLGFLDRAANEWDENGQGFVNGLMTWLRPEYSPGVPSDQNECALRIHIVLLAARLFLARFDAWKPGSSRPG